MSVLMDKEGIKKVIPHRDPMLLVDEVVEMEPETSIVTRFFVSPEREIFKGHFPGDPVLPGVYTVEGLQAGHHRQHHHRDRDPRLDVPRPCGRLLYHGDPLLQGAPA